ncbi:TIGR00645 family protein [Psychromicrobium lacuslunae]|uniref:TIGR00645 family protein n=1 Tax=Psychromicrobium lacuslunae TaxID=1618207 RepID=UPI0009E23294|nr:TIGR00645 family protein [Psychromicrobium lacuslunae]
MPQHPTPIDDNYLNRATPRALGGFIFFSRWLQAPLYLGLIVAQGVYVVLFMKELWHIVTHFAELDETKIMLAVLGLVDVVMIANLLIMVIIGGYETFVSRINLKGHPDQPEWLSHVNANVLKTKLAMSIIGISSIHLLKSFIGAADLYTNEKTSDHAGNILMWQTLIHLAFIVSALALAWIDKMGQKKVIEQQPQTTIAQPSEPAPAGGAGH